MSSKIIQFLLVFTRYYYEENIIELFIMRIFVYTVILHENTIYDLIKNTPKKVI